MTKFSSSNGGERHHGVTLGVSAAPVFLQCFYQILGHALQNSRSIHGSTRCHPHWVHMAQETREVLKNKKLRISNMIRLFINTSHDHYDRCALKEAARSSSVNIFFRCTVNFGRRVVGQLLVVNCLWNVASSSLKSCSTTAPASSSVSVRNSIIAVEVSRSPTRHARDKRCRSAAATTNESHQVMGSSQRTHLFHLPEEPRSSSQLPHTT